MPQEPPLLVVTLVPGVTAVTKLGFALLMSWMLGCSVAGRAGSCRAVAMDWATDEIEGAEGDECREIEGTGRAVEDAAAGAAPPSIEDHRMGTPNVCSGPCPTPLLLPPLRELALTAGEERV